MSMRNNKKEYFIFLTFYIENECVVSHLRKYVNQTNKKRNKQMHK